MQAGSEQLQENDEIVSVELVNASGASVRVLNLGARIAELNIPSREQGIINTVLGYPHLRSYHKDSAFHGAITGRFSNRIARGQFSLGDESFQLPRNDGEHHLHGGPLGFSQRFWHIEECEPHSVVLSLHSAEGDQGYPGAMEVLLRYTLDDDNCLEIDWQALSDRDTLASLSSHAYFNLAGCGDIRLHQLRIAANHYTPVDAELIPTGEILSVDSSPFDLRSFTPLSGILDSHEPAIESTGGLDCNWARGKEDELALSAELYCPETALLLQVHSTLPGLQCYTGNHLGAGGVHGCHEGICLEPQYYPDSPNQGDFPTAVLRAGETRRHRIQYRFMQAEENGDFPNEQ
jgi:aldose 1-epimerase